MKGVIFIAAALLLAVAGGCSGKHKLVSGAPDWVNHGAGAFAREDARVFYGVGSVTGISSPSLAVETADQRARADIARQFDTYVNSLLRDYQSAASVPAGGQGYEEQQVEKSLKTLSQVSVRGARVLKHWKDPESGTVYSLVRLDLEGVRGTAEGMQEIDPSLRSHIRTNAERVFDEHRREGQRR